MTIVPEEKQKMRGDLVDPNSRMPDYGDFVPPNNQSQVQRILNRRRQQNASQKQSPPQNAKNLANLAKNPQSAPKQLLKMAFNLFRQIEPSKDWPFLFILIPMAILKDIFDIAFAAIPGVGIIVSFVTTLLLTILTIVCIILIGERLQTRGSAKYIGGLAIEFISEAFPGIGWLPLFTIETIMIYFFVLIDRAQQSETKEETSSQDNTAEAPAFAAADNYPEEEERMAA